MPFNGSYEGLQYPVNNTPSGMYAWAGNHVTQLRRILEEAGNADTDLTALQAEVDDLQTTVAGLGTSLTSVTDRVTTLEGVLSGVDGRVTTIEGNDYGIPGILIDLDNITTDVVELRTDLTAAELQLLTPQERWEIELATKTKEILGSPAEFAHHVQTQQEIDAEAAMSAAITAHRGLTGIYREQMVRLSETEALAQDISILTADLGVANATIADMQVAVSNGDEALASRLTVAETNVAGNTASIETQQSSINGIYASNTITLSLQGRVIGTQTLSGTPLGSVFAVDADYFSVGSPAYANKPVFAIATINGVAGVAFHGNMFADGTIYARHIVAGEVNESALAAAAVTAAKLAGGAVTSSAVSDAAIGTAALADASIVTNKIAAGAVIADKIAANTITADKMNVTALTAISANFGNATVLGSLTGGPTGKLNLNFSTGRLRALA